VGIRRCSLMYRLPASHGENRGSSPLGSANDFNSLIGSQHDRSGDCLLFVYYSLSTESFHIPRRTLWHLRCVEAAS
jgi:hypothetical protein